MRFIDQVSELDKYLFTNHKNLVLLGDFNVHVNKLDSHDTQSYLDTMVVLGLVQHIDQQTHRLGNILHLVYTEPRANQDLPCIH